MSTDVRTIHIKRIADGEMGAGNWYIHDVQRSIYLHQDGIWRDLTLSEHGTTGLFSCPEVAARTLVLSLFPSLVQN